MKRKAIRRLFALCLSLLLLCGLLPASFAADGVIDRGTTETGVQWVMKTNGTLSVSGKGALYKSDGNYGGEETVAPWRIYAPIIKKLVLSNGITEISDSAFSDCDLLTAVTLPKSVKKIGDSAFAYCEKLKQFNIPPSVNYIGNNAFDDTAWFKAQKDGVVYSGSYAVGWKGENAPSSVKFKKGTTHISPNLLCWKEDVKTVVLPEGLKSIGAYAFAGTGLTCITIPKSVAKIGDGILNYCDSLKSITVRRGNKKYSSDQDAALYDNAKATLMKFAPCSALTSYTVKKGTKVIADSAFHKADKLKKVTLANTVKTIDDSAFSGCSELKSIHIPDSVTSIGAYVFQNGYRLASITGGKGVRSLDTNAVSDNLWYYQLNNGPLYIGAVLAGYIGFYSGAPVFKIKEGTVSVAPFALENVSKYIKKVSLPSTLKSIGSYAFSDTQIESLTIPDSVRKIESGAFSDCAKLKSVHFGKGLKEIAYAAFSGCTALTQVSLPDSLTTLGAYAFDNAGLAELKIPAGVRQLGDKLVTGKKFKRFLVDEANGRFSADENGVLFSKDKSVLLQCPTGAGLTNYTVPAGVKAIGDSAFGDIKTLKSVALPDGVTDIGICAFEKCEALQTINLPESVVNIASWAFEHCESLSEIVLPPRLKALEWGVFRWCKALIAVKVPGSAVIIDGYAFSGCDKLARVVLGEGVQSIAGEVFYNCKSLREITLPKSLLRLNCWAFSDCVNLKKIVVRNKNLHIKDYDSSMEEPPFSEKVTFYAAADSTTRSYCKKHKLAFKAL